MKKICIVLCVAALILGCCACAMTQDVSVSKSLNKMISVCVVEQEEDNYDDFDYFAEAHKVLGARDGNLQGKETDKYITVYLYTLFGGYIRNGDGFENNCGGANPAAMVFEKDGKDYTFVEYWVPRDGAYHVEDLKATFPRDIFKKWQAIEETAESHNRLIAELEAEIQAKLAQQNA